MLLDLELPGRSGLEYLEELMRVAPMPVVVCSGVAQRGTTSAIRALELGAVDLLPKPALGIRALLGSTDIGIASVVGLPVGIGAGLYLAERRGGRLATGVRFLSDVLNGLPSIVLGIFAWAMLVRPFRLRRLSLTCTW